jgi:hypothetical protein
MSAVTGPFSFGYSDSQDEDQLQSSAASTTPMLVRSSTETFTAGVSLRSLALDYSRLTVHRQNSDNPIVISQFVASLIIQRLILTAA